MSGWQVCCSCLSPPALTSCLLCAAAMPACLRQPPHPAACCSWLAPRLAAVQELSITLCSADPLLVGDAPVSATTTLPQGLFGVHGPPLSMRKLTLSWPGQVRLVFPTGGRLSSLRHLSLQNCKSVHLLLAGPCAAPPGLEAFAVVDVEHFELAAPPGAHAAPPGSQSQQWLPPSLTMLRLSDAGLRELPHVLALLPRLRRWVPRAALRRAAGAAGPCPALPCPLHASGPPLPALAGMLTSCVS